MADKLPSTQNSSLTAESKGASNDATTAQKIENRGRKNEQRFPNGIT